MRKEFIVFLVTVVFIFAGCRHTPVIPTSPAVSFAKDVQPIITANCTADGCHGDKSSRRSKFTSYQGVISRIAPGNAHSSSIYQRIIAQGFSTLMPPKSSNQGQLTDAQIKVIYLWIMQGALDN